MFRHIALEGKYLEVLSTLLSVAFKMCYQAQLFLTPSEENEQALISTLS